MSVTAALAFDQSCSTQVNTSIDSQRDAQGTLSSLKGRRVVEKPLPFHTEWRVEERSGLPLLVGFPCSRLPLLLDPSIFHWPHCSGTGGGGGDGGWPTIDHFFLSIRRLLSLVAGRVPTSRSPRGRVESVFGCHGHPVASGALVLSLIHDGRHLFKKVSHPPSSRCKTTVRGLRIAPEYVFIE